MKELVTQPYCPQCGAVRPQICNEPICMPCANTGHYRRLVTNESDRYSRITNWMIFFSNHGYSNEEIKEIPTMQNLINKTFSKIEHEKSKSSPVN